MTKTELVREIAKNVEGATQKDVAVIVDALAEVVRATLTEDHEEKVTIPGLGYFKVKEVPERTGVIRMGERAGEEYVVEAHSEITFKMSKTGKMI
jgi:nucleoid DNA-binding protein